MEGKTIAEALPSPISCQTEETGDSLVRAEPFSLCRQRPAVFPTAFSEIAFCSVLLISMLMAEYFISGFYIILPTLSVALHIPESLRVWPASLFSLVTGAFLLPIGRLVDIKGGYIVFHTGLIWFTLWSAVSGFSRSSQMIIATRALAGLGPAAFLPAGMMLLSKTYRPGPRKNIIFSLYGAFAPLGFFFGILMGGVASDYLSWNWYFWIGALILAATCLMSIWVIPRWSHGPPSNLGQDYLGSSSIVLGIALLSFAIMGSTRAPSGWRTPYILVCVVLGFACLVAAVYIEGWRSRYPLLPVDIFRPRYITPLVFSLVFAYGACGIFLYYTSLYIQDVITIPPMLTALWFTPMAIGGVVLSTFGGLVMHRVSGHILMIVSGTGSLACMLLLALIPGDATGDVYWPFIFPAMVGATIGIDITYNVSNVFITSSVPMHCQGAAGALINSLLFLGNSFFLGLADLVVAETQWKGLEGSYKNAFWLGTACAGCALCFFSYLKIGKADGHAAVWE